MGLGHHQGRKKSCQKHESITHPWARTEAFERLLMVVTGAEKQDSLYHREDTCYPELRREAINGSIRLIQRIPLQSLSLSHATKQVAVGVNGMESSDLR